MLQVGYICAECEDNHNTPTIKHRCRAASPAVVSHRLERMVHGGSVRGGTGWLLKRVQQLFNKSTMTRTAVEDLGLFHTTGQLAVFPFGAAWNASQREKSPVRIERIFSCQCHVVCDGGTGFGTFSDRLGTFMTRAFELDRRMHVNRGQSHILPSR